MKIAFRVDSSNTIGLGHMSRCITLAKVFSKRNCSVYFLSKEIDEFSKKNLKENKFHLFKISSFLNTKKDAEHTRKILKENDISLIFLDNRNLDITWEQEVIKVAKIALIDDEYARKSIADYYINYHGYLYGNKFAKLKNNCKKLIGYEYFILKKNILKKIKNYKNIFVYFGEVDSKNLTRKFINAVSVNKFKNYKFDIHCKKNFKSNLINFKKFKNINLKFLKKENLIQEMSNSKFIITQGGVSLYEALSTSNQVFCIPINNLQKKIIRSLKLFVEFKVIKNFKNLNFKSYSNKNFKLIDGQGANRIVEFFLCKKNFFLRNLSKTDFISLFNLRKDFETKINSINQKDFNFNNHINFLKKKIKFKSKFFIFKFKYNFVGQIRLDNYKNFYYIDYGVTQPYRKNSFSYLMLKKVLTKIKKKKVIAKVKKINKASVHNFFKLRFSLDRINKNIYYFSKQL